uniref:NTP_transf_2 domain-containing protein n=1 Tax=Syphacia muris TaxID=451379 RepID=A0A0N5AZZ2_9BILA
MGGITNLTSQTFCDCLIDFFKRIIYPENSDEKLLAECSSSCTTPETRDRSINCCNSSYSTADCCGYDDISDDYLFLTRMIHESACDSYAHFFDFTFSAEIHIQLFPKTLSAWNLTLKRRRLERYCRKNPFVRYDMQFINNALKDMHYQQMKEKLLSDEHEFTECSSVSEGSGDSGKSKSNDGSNSSDVDISNNLLDDNCFCSVTRPSSPCRSNSTLSSGYSSEELSSRSSVTSNSSLSQYSCSCAPEARMNDDTSLNMEKTAKVAPELYSEINTVSLPSCLADNVDTCDDVLSKETLRPQQIDDSNNIVLPEENSSVSMARKEATYVDDVRLRTHIERAFKYCKLFEILEQSSNRFRISPTTCGLGLPLAHLDHCWPPVNAVRNIESNDIKYARRRTTSIYGKKQRRGIEILTLKFLICETSFIVCRWNIVVLGLIFSAALGFDAVTLQYVSSSSSLSSSSNLYEQDSNFYVSEMDVLSEEIWDFHMSTTQSEEMLNLKIQLRDVLYCALSQLFPMCGLYIVGSSLNGFGTNSSDMDLCLMISSKEVLSFPYLFCFLLKECCGKLTIMYLINQRTDAVVVLDLVRSLFNNMNFIREQKLIIAKVPILRIRFFEPYSKIVVDLNANNSVAIRNTQLLCYYSYCEFNIFNSSCFCKMLFCMAIFLDDWRVRPLVSVVKEWAKRRDINDANRSSFTSYSLVLMVIHYLQCEF